MRIVIDGVIFGLQKTGGISKVWSDLLVEYNSHEELEVILLLPANKNLEWERISGMLPRIKVLKRKRFKWEKHSFLRDSLYLTWLSLRLKPDLWHQTYFVGFPLFFGGKKITTLHDMIPESLEEVQPYDSKMKYLSLKQSDHIIAISEHSKRDLERIWPVFMDKSIVIHNGSKSDFSSKTPQNYFLFIGKRRGYKNFLPSLKELTQHPDLKGYKIKAVGGEVPNKEELATEAEFLGALPENELKELMAHASLILFPSLYEGFGMPLLEAFGVGVPILAMRTSSIPEVVGEEYPLATPGTLAATALKLLQERERWIVYGKKRLELFSVEKMGANMVDFYKTCVFQSSPSHSMPKSI